MEIEIPNTEVDDAEVLDACSVISNEPQFQGPLRNKQHEAFCVMVSTGMTTRRAFEQVFGCRGTPADIQEILALPEVAARLASIAFQYNRTSLVTLMGHVEMLGEIRDAAMDIQEVGVAYQAERARGEAVGIYDGRQGSASLSKIRLTFRGAGGAKQLSAPGTADSASNVQLAFV